MSASTRRDEILREVAAIDAGAAQAMEDGRGVEEQRRRSALLDEYMDLLSRVAVARDPFTGEPFVMAVDDADLDGPFWDYDAPVRPDEDLPPTFFALLGALRLGGPIAEAEFLAKPGPEVPYVIPRMLEHEAVRAVLSSLPVGPHTGYVIAYFAQPVPDGLERANVWGIEEYPYQDDGDWEWDSVDEDESEFDYDLRPWIESGKLQWIAPGDATLTLRSSVDDCPYLDLPGHREITRIQDGEAWWPEDVLDE